MSTTKAKREMIRTVRLNAIRRRMERAKLSTLSREDFVEQAQEDVAYLLRLADRSAGAALEDALGRNDRLEKSLLDLKLLMAEYTGGHRDKGYVLKTAARILAESDAC